MFIDNFVCLFVCLYVSTSMHVCMYVRTYSFVFVCQYVCIYMYTSIQFSLACLVSHAVVWTNSTHGGVSRKAEENNLKQLNAPTTLG